MFKNIIFSRHAWKTGLALLLMTAIINFLMGCAATQKIKINSEPSGAIIVVKDVQMGLTPQKIKFNKKEKNVVIRLQKEGYEPLEVTLTRHFDGWFIPKGILVAALGASSQIIQGCTTKGPVIAAGVGLAAGATYTLFYGFSGGDAYKFKPSEVNVVLKKLEAHGFILPPLSKDEIWVFDSSIINQK